MMTDDPLMQCPYNPSHVILKSRMQVHLVKCSRNYPLVKKMICPFNAIHHVDRPDYHYHVSTCPDRRVIEGHKYELQDSEHGDLAQTPYHQPSLPPDDEDWDAETPVTTYNPQPHVEAAPVIRMLQGATKAERKAFRHRERQRIQNLKEDVTQDGPSASSSTQPGYLVTADVMTPLRLPRETSQALRLLDPNMGLGRGNNSQRMEEVTPGHASLAEHSALGLGRGGSIKDE